MYLTRKTQIHFGTCRYTRHLEDALVDGSGMGTYQRMYLEYLECPRGTYQRMYLEYLECPRGTYQRMYLEYLECPRGTKLWYNHHLRGSVCNCKSSLVTASHRL
jgi:hypothetical protein